MSSSSPISRVVACAGTHFRQNRRLTPDELAFVLSGLGHDLNADDQGPIGRRHQRRDRLRSRRHRAVALDVTPAQLLSHIPDSDAHRGALARSRPMSPRTWNTGS